MEFTAKEAKELADQKYSTNGVESEVQRVLEMVRHNASEGEYKVRVTIHNRVLEPIKASLKTMGYRVEDTRSMSPNRSNLKINWGK